jgi:hypothetical protein
MTEDVQQASSDKTAISRFRIGHFAAWEQPGLFAAGLRASFQSLR